MKYTFIKEFTMLAYEETEEGSIILWVCRPEARDSFLPFFNDEKNLTGLLDNVGLLEMCYPKLIELLEKVESLFTDGKLCKDNTYFVNSDGYWG